ncbi:hypothetical protein P0D69_02375 [Paraburkholderia sediminicola]|uniref:hypothetical protein n=1 Tax=Paraburkholderia sediminicola TaxID=458836 RepID=UPI0038B7B740
MNEEHVNVEQGDSAYDCDSEWVETSGLGPCIGVAIVFNGHVSITHQHGAHANAGYDDFCKEINELVPAAARTSICPIVAGGQLGEDDPNEIMKDRNYVLSTISRLGFGSPQTLWCPDDAESQTILINTVTKTALVEIDFEDAPAQEVILQF